MKRLKVVLDTNVIISGLLFMGIPHEIISRSLIGAFDVVISPVLMEELERVLTLKFPRARSATKHTMDALRDLAILVEPSIRFSSITADPDDHRVLECAVSAKADLIVSGDSHLLVLKKVRSIPIVSPRDFFERLCSGK